MRPSKSPIEVMVGLPSFIVLAGCALFAVCMASRWPLVGDAALMHYVVFLLHAGKIPYSQIVDINFPGTYLLESLAMRIFGAGPIGLRLYDGFLCLSACCLMTSLARSTARARLIGLGCGFLFLLIHLQDGLAQAGQRDLAMAVLLLLAIFFILRVCPRRPLAGIFLFEFAIGLTLIVKPTLLPMALLPVVVPLTGLRRLRRNSTPAWIAASLSGLALPLLGAVFALLAKGAFSAFLNILTTSALSHGELGRRPLPFLFSHCVAPVGVLLLPWIATLAILRPRLDPRRFSLLFAAACGLLSYLMQGKGYPYHRYPFLAAFLLLMAVDLDNALGKRSTWLLGLATACLAGFWFAPTLARDVASFNPATPFETALASDLGRLNDTQSIQCLDTFGGCINTLYNLKVVQSTGFLYDCYLFEGDRPARDEYRRQFLEAFDRERPQLLVLTDEDCFTGTPNPNKLDQWPAFKAELASRYTLEATWAPTTTQHWWHRREAPASYWILKRK